MATTSTNRPRRARARIAIVLVAIVSIAAGGWWLANRERIAAQDAADRMVALIAAMPDGSQVDLADALPIGWERAVFMSPYTTGEQMNEKLGFRGFSDDSWGPADESNQLVVFVSGQSVVTTTDLFPEPGSFRFDPAITGFSRSAARFVVEWAGDHAELRLP